MKVSIKNLGCKINQFDGGGLKERLRESGAEIVESGERADVYVINTCTVTRRSDYHCRQAIRRAVKEKGEGGKVVVTGCYARTNPEEVSRITGVDLVTGELSGIAERLSLSSNKREAGLRLSAETVSGRSRAFLKVQDGCDACCSYCIVPIARGAPRSAPVCDVLKKANGLTGQGFHEIVLTGIHLGLYGRDLGHGEKLSLLAGRLLEMPGLGRLRLSSLEPMEFDEGMLELIGKEKLCRHFHIPLQSADDRVLASMGRNYSADDYFRLVEDISRRAPGACIGADVIVGYPLEDREGFEKTFRMIEGSAINYLHVFSYSPRPGTRAHALGDPVPGGEKRERSLRLRELAKRKNTEFKERFLGKAMTVVVEDKGNGAVSGLTDNYIRVTFDGAGLAPRSAVEVGLESIDGGAIRGKAI